MLKSEEFCKLLKYIERHRNTFYSNVFPFNCGYIYANKSLSFDCINLIKSLINDPTIAKKTEPVGFFVKPGAVVPDLTERGLLDSCTDVSCDFKKIQPGEYLCAVGYGHAGIFVGEYTDPSGVVNVIECTSDMGGGVLSSYVDAYGRRYDHKGGYSLQTMWLKHGKLSKWIDYKKEEKPKKKSVTAIAKEVIAGKWGVYPERKKLLEKAGYDYAAVQKKVNEMLAGK